MDRNLLAKQGKAINAKLRRLEKAGKTAEADAIKSIIGANRAKERTKTIPEADLKALGKTYKQVEKKTAPAATKNLPPEIKIAQRKIKALETKGVETPAYKILKNRLEKIGTSIKAVKQGKVKKGALKYITAFNAAISSTITGMKKVNAKRNATLARKYNARPKDVNILYQVLESTEFELMKNLLPSDTVVEQSLKMIKSGKSPEEIVKFLGNFIKQNEKDEFLLESFVRMSEDEELDSFPEF